MVGYQALLESAAVLPDQGMALLFLEGDDRLEWLHGQTTQDFATMEAGDVREACICSPFGQIVAPIVVKAQESALAIVLPAPARDPLIELADRTVFMESVSLSPGPAHWVGVTVQGPEAEGICSSVGNGALVVRMRPQGDRWFLWSEADSAALVELKGRTAEADAEAAEAVRLELGEPRWPNEFANRVLPPELGPEFVARNVSYRKGCYTGQEVLMRIHARGHTNRTWTGLLCDAPIEVGAPVRAKGRDKAGFVTSAATSPTFGFIAGAFLHNAVIEPRATVWIAAANGEVEATISPFPLRN